MSWLSNIIGASGGPTNDTHSLAKEQERLFNEQEAARLAALQPVAPPPPEPVAAAPIAAGPSARDTFIASARAFAPQKMAATGLTDNYGIGSYYNNLLDQRIAAAGPSADLGAAIDPSTLYDTAYNDVREGNRRNVMSQINSGIGDNYGRTQFGDTVDDSILDSIINTQRGSATSAIERARSRGILNDAGYNSATTQLGERGAAGRAQLEDIGQGVLGRYRSALDTEAEGLRSRAGSLDLTDTFDVAGSIGGLASRAEGFRGRMEGDIRSAAGDKDFFNVGDLLGRAATDQGFVNPGGNPILAAFASDRADKAENDPAKRRLIGSTGAF